MLKNKKYLIIATLIVVLIAAATFFAVQIKPDSEKTFRVKRGNLETVISCKGEVKGEKYTEINLPLEICDRSLYLYQLKIVDMVMEGKAVKKGDYIAKLDDSQITTMMRTQLQEKERMDADLRNAMIDSTVTLSKKREVITNAKLDLEYLKIDLEQSKYESEAYQRKTQMRYQKAEMEVEKTKRDYLLEKNKLKIQVGRSQSRVTELKTRIEKYQKAFVATTIKTPDDGIVMFAKDWTGKTYGKGTDISIWRPLIATLPDMSVVITEAYIKEIDITKIHLNDSVRITIDALSGRVFPGKVIKIANIGEDHKDFDMKAFKVIIRYEKSDKDLKPGMTANNDIIVGNFKDKLLVSRQAVFSKNGKQIVYLKKGGDILEQEIEMIAENDVFIAVENNLKDGDLVLLYQPDELRVEIEQIVTTR